MAVLIHELVHWSAERFPDSEALVYKKNRISYSMLAREMDLAKNALIELGIDRGERVAVYLEKRLETVTALFGTAGAGGVFVPVNPLLKAEQVAYILRDCNVRILVTSVERLKLLANVLPNCHDLRAVIAVGQRETLSVVHGLNVMFWEDALSQAEEVAAYRCIDGDMAAILYTS